MTKKERIIHLSEFLNVYEVAQSVDTTVPYVKKVLSETKRTAKPIEPGNFLSLTIENYVTAYYRMGITRKKDLAAFFGVSRMTINRFENRPEIKQYFMCYMELRSNGYDIEDVLQRLTSIHETLAIFEPKSDRTQRVSQAIELLTAVPKKDNRAKC
ncbi:MAG: hypothetical protein Q4C37_03845 [Bacteroidales bacterium]|nr:hypothetical protein [Bacteroidales bacterium]